jgi:uncharacterized protein (TIGR00297 family)
VTDRKLNFLFQFSLVVVFVLFASPIDKVQILFGLLLAWVVARVVFLNKWLTLDGVWAATIVGTVALGIGGWEATAVLLTFFISSNLLAVLLTTRNMPADTVKPLGLRERRTGLQVWANAFWFVLFILLSYLFHSEHLFLMAAAGMAVATSDTWATLFGMRMAPRSTRLITTWKKTEPGSDGGVSFPGTLAALLGAVLIGFVVLMYPRENRYPALIAVVAGGFSGCMVDSYLGALWQSRNHMIRFAGWSWPVSNDTVNWLATGAGALICLILYTILDYALV